jgi:hypothetical protein
VEEPITYECRKCGNRFVVSNAGERRLVPRFCCGEEVKRIKKKKPLLKKTLKKKKPPQKT